MLFLPSLRTILLVLKLTDFEMPNRVVVLVDGDSLDMDSVMSRLPGYVEQLPLVFLPCDK